MHNELENDARQPCAQSQKLPQPRNPQLCVCLTAHGHAPIQTPEYKGAVGSEIKAIHEATLALTEASAFLTVHDPVRLSDGKAHRNLLAVVRAHISYMHCEPTRKLPFWKRGEASNTHAICFSAAACTLVASEECFCSSPASLSCAAAVAEAASAWRFSAAASRLSTSACMHARTSETPVTSASVWYQNLISCAACIPRLATSCKSMATHSPTMAGFTAWHA